MITIKTREDLIDLLNDGKDLIVDDNLTIEFSTAREDIRNIQCENISLIKNSWRFDLNISGNFTGRDFNGRDFTGNDFTGNDFTGWNFIGRNFTGNNFNGGNFNGDNFTGWDFNGRDFTGRDFTGWDFTGRNFIGRNISYYAFFCCYGQIIKCGKLEGRHAKAHPPIELGKGE